MSLTAADVAEIMRLVEQSSFDELILEMDGIKLSLRRGAPAHSQPNAAPGVEPAATSLHPDSQPSNHNADVASGTSSSPPLQRAPWTDANVEASADPSLHEVTSPLLGTFYRAPKPGAPPFVEVGSPVEADTIVAIIEVMKLMNTVRAGVQGTVTEIVIADGDLAEYGQPLLRVRKAG